MSDDPALARLAVDYVSDPLSKATEAIDQCAPLPPPYDPDQQRRAYEDEVVGPNGGTRAEMRNDVLRRLDALATAAEIAQARGEIAWLEGFKLRLQIHDRRCALLGLGTSMGSPW